MLRESNKAPGIPGALFLWRGRGVMGAESGKWRVESGEWRVESVGTSLACPVGLDKQRVRNEE